MNAICNHCNTIHQYDQYFKKLRCCDDHNFSQVKAKLNGDTWEYVDRKGNVRKTVKRTDAYTEDWKFV